MTALKESNKPRSLDQSDWRESKRKPNIIVFEGSSSDIDALVQTLLQMPETIVVRPRAHNDSQIIIASVFNAGERVVGMLHDKVVGPEQSKRRMTTEYQDPTPVHKI